MQSRDIKVGVEYAHNRYGRQSGRYAARLGDKFAVRVTVLAPPRNGRVEVRTYPDPEMGVVGRELDSVPVRELLGTWAEHEEIRDGEDRARAESIDRHRADDARIRELLGPVYDEYNHYVGFEVYPDGTYSRETSRLRREVLREMLEAAYENGREAEAKEWRDPMNVKTRVRQDPLNGNRWQAQYFNRIVQVWFDLGDAKDTREEAEANLALAPRPSA